MVDNECMKQYKSNENFKNPYAWGGPACLWRPNSETLKNYKPEKCTLDFLRIRKT